jgi:hypothetical protein|tara:strand:- start:14116 stop:15363 length:1248 start_codon:yes stop_codon:yes gene_type:complete
MSSYSFTLPASSQTLAVSRTNWNSSFEAVLRCFYGNQLPAAGDVVNEGSTALEDGMLYRDSANAALYIRDSSHFRGQTGHIIRNFTRVGIGTRIVKDLATAGALGSGGKFTAFEEGELICVVGNSAGAANNRLYLRTANAAGAIADVSVPADGTITSAKLANPISISYAANVTGNVSVTRSLSVGYTDGAVPQANLEVKGNAYVSGQLGLGNGSAGTPSFAFGSDTNTGLYRTGADSIGITAGGTHRVTANTGGLYPLATNTYDVGGASNKWRGMYATKFFGEATSALYADLAERFESDMILEEGDVVMIGGEKEITKTDRESTPDVFGVISIRPAYAMNSDIGSDDTHPYVALAGKVPVKVIGKVLKGQRLVASSQTGIAIAAETKNIFAVVGRALESSDALGIKLIQAVVGKL